MIQPETAPCEAFDGNGTFSLYDAVAGQARANGTAPAVVDLADSGEALDYAALVERVDALAARLESDIGGPGDVVAVVVERSVDAIISMLAALAAGVAYCPLDPTLPPERLHAMIKRLGVGVAIADENGAAILGDRVDIVVPRQPLVPTRRSTMPSPADGVAYVLHTSGSTGIPKAVAMTHRGLDRLIGWQVADGVPGLRTLQFTATSFDVIFQEVLSTLVTGGCLVLTSDEVRRNPDAVLSVIVEHHIQRLFLPYVALQSLALAAARRGVTPDSLEHVITAGERLIITPAIRDLFDALPHCRLDNHYGPTETHLVTSLPLANGAANWPEVPEIGRPVASVSCHVLDERLKPVDDDEVGELYVAGGALAAGYLQDPARTAQRFVASPFTDGERLYRTGDLVRRSDDEFDFVGRADSQLKVRGYRVEPGEVEAALVNHPSVDAAAVGLRDLAEGVPVLVGYVQTEIELSYRDLTEHLRDRLPGYMIPSRFVTVSSLPVTSSGKTDGQALAALELPEDPASTSMLSATQAVGEVVAAIWRRVLGHSDFEPDDDFFDVGGDSLLATWLAAELTQELGTPVGLSALLADSTMAGIADSLELGDEPVDHRPSSSRLVTLRPGPSATSLYLVHPLGGELVSYRELARASRAPMRLVGLSWSGSPPPTGSSLPDMARLHMQQLRAVQPVGPYFLTGWSFGGVLAYEMARQLRADGADVGLLGLIDANPVIDPVTGLPLAETPFLEMIDDLLARLEDPATTDAEVLELTSQPIWMRLMGGSIDAGASSSYLGDVLRVARACMDAAMRYDPLPYDGEVTLFHASGAPKVDDAARQERVGALRKLCLGELTVVELAGEHWSVMRSPHVVETACRLDESLARAGDGMRVADGL